MENLENNSPISGEVQIANQIQRLFKTRDAALDFAKLIRDGDVLVQGGMLDGKKVWQLTYNKETD